MGLQGEGDVKLELECEVLDADQKFTRLPVTASPLLRVPSLIQAFLNYGCVLSLV